MAVKVLLLPGDGIGPEVTAEARAVLAQVAPDVEFEEAMIGGCAIDAEGAPISDETIARAIDARLVLLGAVGGPKWDHLPADKRAEKGLLRIRKDMELYANLRPVQVIEALADATPLRPEAVKGVDLVVVRELTGGLYFGEPRGRDDRDGVRRALNTLVYDENEVRRIARVAFETARRRRNRVTNIHKANVLEVCGFWNEIVEETHAEYSDVTLDHLIVDAAAMALLRDAPEFDVMLCPNLFGDILSDEASMITGSLGMLPSASIGDSGRGLFEPVHGSAPDLAGQDVANPLAAILCVAMLLEHGLERGDEAERVRAAVSRVLDAGARTTDLARRPGDTAIGTREMGRRVRDALDGQ